MRTKYRTECWLEHCLSRANMWTARKYIIYASDQSLPHTHLSCTCWSHDRHWTYGSQSFRARSVWTMPDETSATRIGYNTRPDILPTLDAFALLQCLWCQVWQGKRVSCLTSVQCLAPPATQQEDYFKTLRTNVLLIWTLSDMSAHLFESYRAILWLWFSGEQAVLVAVIIWVLFYLSIKKPLSGFLVTSEVFVLKLAFKGNP